jgi:cell division protein FtsA
MNMKEQELIAGIDLGSSKFALTVGDYKDGEIDIKDYAIKESVGIRGGVVVDLKAAAECISEMVSKAEKKTGKEISSVFVGISGQHIHSSNSEGKLVMPTDQEEIGIQHLREVISKAKVNPSSLGMEVLHLLPSEFLLDGVGGIREPLGLFGKELTVKATSITGLTTATQNTIRCINLAGLDVEQIILTMIATGEVALYSEEKDLGVGLIDIGAHLTDIAVYKGEYPVYSSVLPYGGENLSRNIATHFHISLKDAEKIKKSHGVSLRYLLENNKEISVGKTNTSQKANLKKISKLELAEILEEKCEMLVSNIRKRIENFLPSLGSGIVLTGGTSNLLGLKETMEEEMGLPVRIGKIKSGVISESSDIEEDFSPYMTSVGLIAYGQRLRDKERNFPWEKETPYDKTVGKVINWIRNFF